ncbi:MAG: ABC transporter substrate-binding protein [Pseudomonadota bacterium]
MSNTVRLVLSLCCAGFLAGGAMAEPINFTDEKGKTVTLEGPAERVVTIPIPAASVLIAVDGGTDHLVGMHPLSKTAIKNRPMGEFFPEAMAIPSDITPKGFTFVPNVEELLALDPDLVFQWGHLSDDIIAPIENAGLNVATIRIGREEFTIKWLEMMGAALGKPEKAQTMIDWRNETRQMLEEQTSQIPDEDRPRVLYLMNYLSKLRVAGGKSYNNFAMNLAGGKNVAEDLGMFVDVGPEQILEWDPEIILLNGFEPGLTPQDVYDNPLFADLTAVKDRRVYLMPMGGYRWDPPNHESPLSWLWQSMVFHPDKFNWPLRDMIDENYQFIYGHSVDSEMADGILRMKANGDAANYGQFAAEPS